MKIKKIEHFSINVSNLEKSIAFYRDILSFQLLETRIPDGGKTITYLDIDGHSRLELFDYPHDCEKGAPIDTQTGYVHVAFEVDDVDVWVEHFRRNAVTITLEPCDLAHLGMRVCLFNDPDGNTLEICAPLKK